MALTIPEIQGPAHVSPYVNRQIRDAEGIVTAVIGTRSGRGFFMQDPVGDGNPATSDGVFVFTGASLTVAVGDRVRVSGRAFEFRPGCTVGANTDHCVADSSAFNNLTTTGIIRPVVTTIGSGNPLPDPVVIGAGGRLSPAVVIAPSVEGSVESPTYPYDPLRHGLDFFESLEGMRVAVQGAVAVGPTNKYGEIPVAADNGAGASLRTPRGGLVLRQDDFNPERVMLDDRLIGGMPQVKVGDRLGGVIGVMDYSFGNYKLLLTQTPTVVPGTLPKTVAREARPEELTVAGFNVENLAAISPERKFSQLATHIVTNLRAPDIIALQEVQDNDGPKDRGVVHADRTWRRLMRAIRAAGGPVYEARQIDPENNADGGVLGGNIRVGYLFNPDRVSYVDVPGGGSTVAVAMMPGPNLSHNPGRIDPANPAWMDDNRTPNDPAWEPSRRPLAAQFRFNGQTLFVVNVHLKSKSQDQPLYGRFQSPRRSTEAQRSAQVEVLRSFAESLFARDPRANLLVIGDLNDFQFSDPLSRIETTGLFNLTHSLPEAERYTYLFDGNAQALDHALVSPNLRPRTTYEVLHVNSEFPTADRSSDHDPILLRIDFTRNSHR